MQCTEKQINNTWIEYTLVNDIGMQVSFLNYGGIITKMMTPDQHGKSENIVLSYHDYDDYQRNSNYFGAIIGRVAGRIKHASLPIHERTYPLDINEGNHHLHGGHTGFHQVIWKGVPFEADGCIGVKLSHVSPDGASGYPGEVHVTVTYTLTNNNEFKIDYGATTDQTTALTLTNHSYFNLTGGLKETIASHHVQMDSSQYIELDHELIPTGKINSVENSPLDFRYGRDFQDGFVSHHPQNKIAGNGYDHYFLFSQDATTPITVKDPLSGRVLTVQTSQPGVVLYTANGLDETCNLREGQSKKHLGFCLETQAPPASLQDERLPDILIDPDHPYQQQTVFTFNHM